MLSTPTPLFPLTLTLCDWGPPDSLGSKANTAATHQTRFESPCVHKCWMANDPKIRLLECGPEFLQRWILWHEGELLATYEVHKKQNASFCAPHRKEIDLIKASIWSSNRFLVNIYTLIQKPTSTHLPWVAFASSRGTAYLSPSTADSHRPQPITTNLPACHEERGMAEASRGFLKDANPHCVQL